MERISCIHKWGQNPAKRPSPEHWDVYHVITSYVIGLMIQQLAIWESMSTFNLQCHAVWWHQHHLSKRIQYIHVGHKLASADFCTILQSISKLLAVYETVKWFSEMSFFIKMARYIVHLAMVCWNTKISKSDIITSCSVRVLWRFQFLVFQSF